MPDSESSLPPTGPTLRRALKTLVDTLEAHSVRYAIIGGIATIQHGRVRTTNDIDVLLVIPQISAPHRYMPIATISRSNAIEHEEIP